jgi:hypothetical protein
MRNTKSLIIGNTLAFFAMVYVNYLSNTMPINGNTPGELSDKYVNYFVPAGFTFAIWGVIYGWLFVFIGFQIVSFFNEKIEEKINPIIEKIGWLFVISCVLNVSWLLAWHYEFVGLSVLVMLSFLSLLLYLNYKIGIGKTKISSLEKWISHAPFSIYVGWISIATIANITALLVNIGWSGFGLDGSIWAINMTTIGAIITVFVLFKRNAILFALVVLWAFYGIYTKRMAIGDENSLAMIPILRMNMVGVIVFTFTRAKKWFSY